MCFTNGLNNVRRPMMTDYAQLFVSILLLKLYGFADFVYWHIVPYKYATFGLVVIEASMWLLYIEGILL